MGNKISSKRDIKLLLLGLDGAGKTTLLQNLANEYTEEDQIPSKGFASRLFTKGRYNILLMDIGGGTDIRGIWPKYFAETHSIIYVVDISDVNRISESKEELRKVLMDDRVTCKPLLVICNKADLRKPSGKEDESPRDTMGILDVMAGLDLQNLLKESGAQCEGAIQPKTRMWLCSALKQRTGNRQDRRIKKATKWLLNTVSDHWMTLAPRVESQFNVEETERQRVKAERIERRRKKQAEEDEEERRLQIHTGPATMQRDNGGHLSQTPVHFKSQSTTAVVESDHRRAIVVEAEIENDNKAFPIFANTKPPLTPTTTTATTNPPGNTALAGLVRQDNLVESDDIPQVAPMSNIVLSSKMTKSLSCESLDSLNVPVQSLHWKHKMEDLTVIVTPPLIRKGQLPPIEVNSSVFEQIQRYEQLLQEDDTITKLLNSNRPPSRLTASMPGLNNLKIDDPPLLKTVLHTTIIDTEPPTSPAGTGPCPHSKKHVGSDTIPLIQSPSTPPTDATSSVNVISKPVTNMVTHSELEHNELKTNKKRSADKRSTDKRSGNLLKRIKNRNKTHPVHFDMESKNGHTEQTTHSNKMPSVLEDVIEDGSDSTDHLEDSVTKNNNRIILFPLPDKIESNNSVFVIPEDLIPPVVM